MLPRAVVLSCSDRHWCVMKRSSYGGDEAFARHGDDNLDVACGGSLKGSENAVSQPVVVGRPAGATSSSGGTDDVGDSAHEDDPSPHGRLFRTGISPAENQVCAVHPPSLRPTRGRGRLANDFRDTTPYLNNCHVTEVSGQSVLQFPLPYFFFFFFFGPFAFALSCKFRGCFRFSSHARFPVVSLLPLVPTCVFPFHGRRSFIGVAPSRPTLETTVRGNVQLHFLHFFHDLPSCTHCCRPARRVEPSDLIQLLRRSSTGKRKPRRRGNLDFSKCRLPLLYSIGRLFLTSYKQSILPYILTTHHGMNKTSKTVFQKGPPPLLYCTGTLLYSYQNC